MSSEEKRSWIHGIIAIVGYLTYLVIVLAMATRHPLTEVAYQVPLLASVAGGIVATIVLSIVLGVGVPRGVIQKDQRDREIYAFGEQVGSAFVVIGGIAALVLAMIEADWFWIANVLYLLFVVSAVTSAMTRLAAYRRGMPAW